MQQQTAPKPEDATGSRLSRATSNTFRAFFALATVIAAGGTYLAITDKGLVSGAQSSLMWLLVANLVLIAGVGGVLLVRVLELIRENRETNGGARLRLRILFLFSLAAAIPTVIVAGFLALAINRSVESWFGEPVYNLVRNGSAAAQASVDEEVEEVRSQAEVMADDLNLENYVQAYNEDREIFQSLMESQIALRDYSRAAIVDSNGSVTVEVSAQNAPQMPKPSAANWQKAREGGMAMTVDATQTTALMRLGAYPDAFLYVSRPIPPVVSARLTQAQKDLNSFREAEARREQLSLVLMLSYIEAALLMLLGTAWLGMTAAARIAGPIGQLAAAARAVRDGDLTVRTDMARPKARDEIDDLAEAFNQMTDRVARQTRALDRGRIDAETRSAFIEAVLSGVEAGVIRVDSDLHVTLANTYAETMLAFEVRYGEALALEDIAPEFASAAAKALETGVPVDLAVRRATESGTVHYQVRIAPEAEHTGAVITFNDTTRLVMGQRQAAWRDVARRIAHEIRNPLTPIQLSAERLRRRFSNQIETDRETFDRCTETITRQVADIGRMVEEFSGFARMPKPTFAEFGLTDMVQSAAFSQRMATPDVSITVNSAVDGLKVLGDERMLAQAMTNILKNAAEAIERNVEEGTVKSGMIAVDLHREGDEVEINIRDNGPGFPPGDRDRVLEPYVTTRKNGVGLGLAIVVRIIEDHGGRIWLSDNPQAPTGALVTIRLPVQPNISDEFIEYADEGAN
ncbi:MAG: PAS domain-containing sensor histidine kinase [Hyphomonadaceae bacterium]